MYDILASGFLGIVMLVAAARELIKENTSESTCEVAVGSEGPAAPNSCDLNAFIGLVHMVVRVCLVINVSCNIGLPE